MVAVCVRWRWWGEGEGATRRQHVYRPCAMAAHAHTRGSLPSAAATNRLTGVYAALAISWIAWWCSAALELNVKPAGAVRTLPSAEPPPPPPLPPPLVDVDSEADAVEAEAKGIYDLQGEEACRDETGKCFQLVFTAGLKMFPSHPGLVQAGPTPPLSKRQSAREHGWGAPTPISVLSGRRPATF